VHAEVQQGLDVIMDRLAGGFPGECRLVCAWRPSRSTVTTAKKGPEPVEITAEVAAAWQAALAKLLDPERGV
jgi:hypothetical protein